MCTAQSVILSCAFLSSSSCRRILMGLRAPSYVLRSTNEIYHFIFRISSMSFHFFLFTFILFRSVSCVFCFFVLFLLHTRHSNIFGVRLYRIYVALMMYHGFYYVESVISESALSSRPASHQMTTISSYLLQFLREKSAHSFKDEFIFKCVSSVLPVFAAARVYLVPFLLKNAKS